MFSRFFFLFLWVNQGSSAAVWLSTQTEAITYIFLLEATPEQGIGLWELCLFKESQSKGH
jgi:hypothetical protein